MIIRPQEGFQMKFLSTSADIAIGGGAAGGGKSYALLLEAIRNIKVPGFGGVIFRKTKEQVRQKGGLWETAQQLYMSLIPNFRESKLDIVFSDNVSIQFSQLEYEKDLLNWQGSQIAFIGFDELTHFTWKQFSTMISRNRSTCGVRPYIRATCNPDPDSWLADFISWYLDEEGYVIKERSGVIRYFTLDGDNVVWGDSRQEVIDKCPHKFQEFIKMGKDPSDLVKSFTFIDGDVYGNKILLDVNPDYLGNLLALPEAEQKRFLDGNWKVKINGMMLAEYERVEDMYTNAAPTRGNKGITIDHARFGRDLLIVTSWDGWDALRIDVLTKSDTNQIVKLVKEEHQRPFRIGNSDVLTDQDGIGVHDALPGSKVYYGGSQPITLKGKKLYQNLKTQCHYHLCQDVINENLIRINLDNIYVDGQLSTTVVINGKTHNIKDLISRQIRTIRKTDIDRDGKLRMESKEQQKNNLNGMSPDFSDNFAMRSAQMIRASKRRPRSKNG